METHIIANAITAHVLLHWKNLRTAWIVQGMYTKKLASNNSTLNYESIMKPRNSKQIVNLQQNERSKSRLTHDALYNLHELAGI